MGVRQRSARFGRCLRADDDDRPAVRLEGQQGTAGGSIRPAVPDGAVQREQLVLELLVALSLVAVEIVDGDEVRARVERASRREEARVRVESEGRGCLRIADRLPGA